jgi:hypothetical protein
VNKRIEIEGRDRRLTNTFVLPMVGLNHKTLPNNFINSYILDDYKVVAVYDKNTDYNDIFAHHLNRVLDNNKHLIEYQDLDDEIDIFFKIPEEFKDDFDLYLLGKYSEFSDDFKAVLTSFFGIKTIKEGHTVSVHNTIYPEDFKRKLIAEHLSYKNSVIDYTLIKEVLDRPNLDKERFKQLSILTAQNTTF